MKKIVSILLFVLLGVLLFINAFTLCLKSDVLKSSVINRLIDSSDIYESVYNEFEREGKEKAAMLIEDNDLDPQLGDWMWNNISEVFTENYIENLTRINVQAVVDYILGESDELATFDLLPKYAQLMDVTAKNLDADVVSQVIGIENDNAKKALSILDGVIKSDSIKKQVVESIFESTDRIKTPFMITTTEQLFGFAGHEQQLENIYDARLKVQKFRRYASSLLIMIILVCMIIIIINFSDIKKCLNDFWIAFAVSGILVLLAGLAIGFFEINVIEFINENISNIGFSNKQSGVGGILFIIASGTMKIGLVYVIISVVFLVLTFIFKNKLQKR